MGLLSSKTPPDQGFRGANEQDGRKASASESLAFEVSTKFFFKNFAAESLSSCHTNLDVGLGNFWWWAPEQVCIQMVWEGRKGNAREFLEICESCKFKDLDGQTHNIKQKMHGRKSQMPLQDHPCMKIMGMAFCIMKARKKQQERRAIRKGTHKHTSKHHKPTMAKSGKTKSPT